MTQDKQSGSDAAAPIITNSPTLEKYHQDLRDRVRNGLPLAAAQLKAAGVAQVELQYDGCGDSGQIELAFYRGADGGEVDISGRMSMSEEELFGLFYDLLESRHAGWENNDGACGEFHWDLVADTLHHTHNDRYTDYETTEHEGL